MSVALQTEQIELGVRFKINEFEHTCHTIGTEHFLLSVLLILIGLTNVKQSGPFV